MNKGEKLLSFTVIMIGIFLIFTSSCKKNEDNITVTDIEGNVYHTVTIGSQIWMVENLQVTSYNDGTAIPNITDNNIWMNLKTGAYCNYNNDMNMVNTYGRLYNWYAVNTQKICPTGWHVPADTDWPTFTLAQKSANGFPALPGGYRNIYDGIFSGISNGGYWWTSSEYSSISAWRISVHFGDSELNCGHISKNYGFSVRCVKN
jgi:hypothetical protein